MVLNSLEEPNRLQMVRVTSPSRLRLTRPINRHILSMPFHESLPVLPIPRIIQRLHQPKILLNCQTKTSPKLPTISTNSILMRTSEFPSAGNIVLQSVFENDDHSVFGAPSVSDTTLVRDLASSFFCFSVIFESKRSTLTVGKSSHSQGLIHQPD